MLTIDIQSALIGVFVTIAVATEMLLRRRNRRTDVLFVILSLNVVLWYLSVFVRGVYGDEPWRRAELAIAALIPASLLRLFLDLLRGGTAASLRLMTICYVASAFVAVFGLSPIGELPMVQYVVGIYIVGMMLAIARATMGSARAAPGTVEYARLRYLAIGAVVTTTLTVLGRLPWFGQAAAATGHAVVVVYIFFLSQAIARERLLDLYEFVGRLLVLAAMALLFAAISAVLVVGLGNNPAMRIFNTIVSVIILLTLYEPIKDRLEEKIIELIVRERHALKTELEQLRRNMVRVLDPDRMVKLVLDTIYDARRATHAAIYLLEPLGRAFRLQGFRGPEPLARVSERDLPQLWHAIHHHHGPLLTENLSRARHDRAANRDLIEAMRKVSADVLLPFVSGDRVLGFLALRDDRVAEPYATEEIALLMNMTEVAVVVLENSQLATRLRERDRLAAIGEMAAGLAHEIRNPLGAIKGAAEYLEPNKLQSKEDGEFVQIIVDETDRLNTVVSQFLDYARPFRAQFQATNLNDVIQKTAKLVEARAGQRASTPIELELDPTLPTIEVDAEQIKQVVLNLALNAVDASVERPHAVITIRTRHNPERERVEIMVRDRGVGIPREALDHLFIPFFTTKPKGTGLGLAVCQRIVTNHGGEIRVESEVGEGTQFTVRLPTRPRRDASTTGSFPNPVRVSRARGDDLQTSDVPLVATKTNPRPRTSAPPPSGDENKDP